jgi:hypothetical protein
MVLLLSACGGDAASADTVGVASIDDLEQSAVGAASEIAEGADEAGVELSAEEAGLLLSSCMRDNGYPDFPDPSFDAEGNLNLRDAIATSGIDFRDETVREQLDVCRDEAGAENFGAGGGGVDREAIQEQLLTYTDCLRAEGLDVGDLAFGGAPGQGQAQDGAAANGSDGDDAAAGGRGQAQGNGGAGGDRSARIANQLGLDVDDPDTAAAVEACSTTLDEALAGFGPGGAAPAATANTDS